MKKTFASLILTLALPAAEAYGATGPTAVDIPLGGGVTQRIAYSSPDAPIATLVALPGGDGIAGIRNDGTPAAQAGVCNPFSRNWQRFAERGVAVALVDAASDGTVRDYNAIYEVVKEVRRRANVPVWIAGGSNSTAIALRLIAELPSEIPVGGIVFSSNTFSASTAGAIRRPVLSIYHVNDTDQHGAQLYLALTNATPRGSEAMTGGSNAGCLGPHTFDGLDAEFVSRTSDFMTRNVPLAGALNFQGLWWQSPALSGNGWGLNIAHQGNVLFATWFTYDADGSPLWLSSDLQMGAGQSFSGQVYQSTSAPFTAYNPAQFSPVVAGTATLTFTDANNGTFAYTLKGVSQSKPIVRFVYSSPVPTCAQGGTQSANINYEDLWWRSPANSENGWGINISHQGDALFVTWFTYGADGTDLWMVMDNAARTAPGVYSGTIHQTRGAPFSAYTPTLFTATPVGTGTFTFSDANNGTFAYTVNGTTQSKPITRFVFASPTTTCRF